MIRLLHFVALLAAVVLMKSGHVVGEEEEGLRALRTFVLKHFIEAIDPDIAISEDKKDELRGLQEQDMTISDLKKELENLAEPDMAISEDKKDELRGLQEQDMTISDLKKELENLAEPDMAISEDKKDELRGLQEQDMAISEDKMDELRGLQEQDMTISDLKKELENLAEPDMAISEDKREELRGYKEPDMAISDLKKELENLAEPDMVMDEDKKELESLDELVNAINREERKLNDMKMRALKNLISKMKSNIDTNKRENIEELAEKRLNPERKSQISALKELFSLA
ncbi:uncharacterized protein PF3D7_1120000-like isoform X8 [Ptychodera flava]|uniref:uncharacterized protein PF3D7_1120000-like isoform X8 n=1 Tax=Ptychodera flava TaxID=63121 RepID=UPI00396A71F0